MASGLPLLNQSLLVQAGIISIAGLGIVILAGFAGQLSIGHAAFFGIGGYVNALLVVRTGISPLVATLVGALICAVLSWLIGRLIFRTAGHYLALATLALGLVAETVVKEQDSVGGAVGLADIPPIQLGSWILSGDASYYWLVAGVLFVATLLCSNLLHSVEGQRLKALGDSEIATAAAGLEPMRLKTRSLITSAVLASVAGSLYAHWTSFIDPTMMGLLQSVQFLIIVVIGGMRSVWGAPVGALFLLVLTEGARETLPLLSSNVGGNFEIAVYGVVLVIFLLFLPQGIVGFASEKWANFQRHRSTRRKG
ncbi:branched-chain amino acid ABC transporter permease [Pseudonocardia hispaniensis]|uniref:Branched-chain amino acid ABC transporter permease n=1 Tax=Pseudonocardia hispaniensis TaxID=904933 RepID=A0ABW1IYS4_9PSEU